MGIVLLSSCFVTAVGLGFAYNKIYAIEMTMLNKNSFVIGYCDGTNGDTKAIIYYANRSNITGEITVNPFLRGCTRDYTVALDSFNKTAWVIAYTPLYTGLEPNTSTSSTRYNVYDDKGNVITQYAYIDDYSGVSYSIAISTLNETHFVVMYVHQNEQNIYFNNCDVYGNCHNKVKVADGIGASSQGMSIEAWNSTQFVGVFFNDSNNNLIYFEAKVDGTFLKYPTYIANYGESDTAELSLINSTHYWVGSYYPSGFGDYHFGIVYSSAGSAGGQIVYFPSGANNYHLAAARLNDTHTVFSFRDGVNDEYYWRIIRNDNHAVDGTHKLGNSEEPFGDIISEKYWRNINLELCDDAISAAWVLHWGTTPEADFDSEYTDGSTWNGKCDSCNYLEADYNVYCNNCSDYLDRPIRIDSGNDVIFHNGGTVYLDANMYGFSSMYFEDVSPTDRCEMYARADQTWFS